MKLSLLEHSIIRLDPDQPFCLARFAGHSVSVPRTWSATTSKRQSASELTCHSG
jgi:hypothetical protein